MKAPRLVPLCLGLLCPVLISGAHAGEENASTRGATTPNAIQASKPTGDWRQRVGRSAAAPAPSAGMLFESKSWTPAQPSQAVIPKTEPPLPEFPYHYMGRLQSEGKSDTVYLTKGNHVYSVTVGEVIGGMYRVVEIASDRLDVIYLPLAKKQQIALSTIVQPAQPRPTHARANPSIPPPLSAARVVNPSAQPPVVNAERNAQSAVTDARMAGARTGVDAQQIPFAGALASQSAAPAATVRPPGYGSGPIVVPPPSISGGSGSTSTNVPTPTPAARAPTPAPTVRDMPVSPPSGGAMVILPPTTTTMPILPPGQGM